MKNFIILIAVIIFLAFTTSVFAQTKEGYTRVIFKEFSLTYKDTDKATRIKLDEFRTLLKELTTMAVNIEASNGSAMEVTSIATVHTCHNADGKSCGDDIRNIMDEDYKFDSTPEPKATPTPK